ncbi:DUF4177 domain-containing protein [Salipiger sp. IMCC34102]|uniref:DUF4177 domain-containing protein n=1 Tax=Salipiger sp. IMCC34102 TaxID=2510647 RepID=UPI00101B8E2A|nr:DUF4177 domain-containing protein [Salipiger sp. IMCC34102]RYH02705.1 DUF4177 domain-containing protein [Salipiger sp. IMCC34102]
MALYEYLVVPAPRKGLKEKGMKGVELRFAAAMSTVLNRYASDGWEYLRTDTLPAEERDGLMMNRVTVFQNLLVFRRPKTTEAHTPETAPALIEDHSDARDADGARGEQAPVQEPASTVSDAPTAPETSGTTGESTEAAKSADRHT